MQWWVFECVFSWYLVLILIGDFKQVIYGFCGGDIYIYFKVVGIVDVCYMLGVNWCSDWVLVESLQMVLCDVILGYVDIVVCGIDVYYVGYCLVLVLCLVLFWLCVVKWYMFGYDGIVYVLIEVLCWYIFDDLVVDVVVLLVSGVIFVGWFVVVVDIVVIVEYYKDVWVCWNVLVEVGILVIYIGDIDVFVLQVVKDWLCLLEVFDVLQCSGLVCVVVCMMFFGEIVELFVVEGDVLIDWVVGMLCEWVDYVCYCGVVVVFQVVQLVGMGWCVLSQCGGEWDLIDLVYIVQLLYEVVYCEWFGLFGLCDWLCCQVKVGVGLLEYNCWLDSDVVVVQIMIVFVVKGLQFFIVYLLFVFNCNVCSDDILLYYDDGICCLYIGGKDGGVQWCIVEGLNCVEVVYDNFWFIYVVFICV